MFPTQVKFVKTDPKAYLRRGTPYAAGFDISMVSFEKEPIEDFYTFKTGIKIEIPEKFFGMIVPRSSISKLDEITMLRNTVGIIDSDYRGEILIKLQTKNPNFFISHKSYFQLILIKQNTFLLSEVKELSDTERGEGGFGSTDNKQ